jgi:Reverse transcriptase (RNA-dependent DNA polymerase)
LISNNFTRGKNDTILFTKAKDSDILLVQIYIDDIIFSSTNVALTEEFSSLMSSKFEISMISELTFFLGIQIK